ncbi:hypothetical protein BKA65DRAFT_501040 [Rhexocercosporidium sp. MPI-PUGE-AT-0058]|nr:hypothetical protein BKA65DRAFT_501040 [Rhexocercosporidium sp. MPI-PUGE-AT-0058]
MQSPRILIAGGGIGGLALAQGLKRHNIPFTVFEKDPSPNSRAQGYRIRIAGNGAVALHECLGKDNWSLFERTCANVELRLNQLGALDATSLSGQVMPGMGSGPGQEALAQRVWGKAGLKSDPNVKRGYAVDRKTLRSLLTLGMEENVKYGKSFARYETTDNGVKAFFSDGTSEEGTLLVGAEGVASAVRKQFLPDYRYVDTGTRCLYGKTPITSEFESQFTTKAMKGMGVIKDKNNLGVFLEAMRFPTDASIESDGRLEKVDDYVYWVFGGSAEDIGLSDSQFHSLTGKAAADLTVELTKSWDPSIKCLFELQDIDQCAPLRLVSARPVQPDWKPSARVTLLGDAAHAMMPAGGSGANTALADAALLLDLIIQQGVTEHMLTKYVEGMWKYALPAIELSAAGGEKLLGFKGFQGAREIDF